MERIGPQQRIDKAVVDTRPLAAGNQEQGIKGLRQEKPAGTDFSWLEVGAAKGREYSQNPIPEESILASGRSGPSENHD